MEVISKYGGKARVCFVCKNYDLVAEIDQAYLENSSIFEAEVLSINLIFDDDVTHMTLNLSNKSSIQGDILSFDDISGHEMWIALIKASVLVEVYREAFEVVLEAVEKYRQAQEKYHEFMKASGMIQSLMPIEDNYRYIYRIPGIPSDLVCFEG